MIRIKRGLDLPISGNPEQIIESGRPVRSVALISADYPGLKPTMEVAVGDRVIAGQLVFTDKKTPGVKFTAPATGTVSAINRGAKRVFQSLVIDVDDSSNEAARFDKHSNDEIQALPAEKVSETLIDSGLWTEIRTRPFGKVPSIDSRPRAIFITAMDSRPLSADPTLVINEQKDAFLAGVDAMARLTDGTVYICSEANADIPQSENSTVRHEQFFGPHPSGLPGTHIHFLDPVNIGKTVWTVGYQELIAIGHLFLDGQLYHERVISLAGPDVERPRLIRTRMGASTDELTSGEIRGDADHRIISGSVLDGRSASGPSAYLGVLHNQVSVLKEGTEREFLGYVMPGTDKFSLTRLFASAFIGTKKFMMTTNKGGSERAMVPTGSYEEIMPLDILPTQLLRALLVDDFDGAIDLGCLELNEDDLALCTFACIGKYEYGPYLRQMLNRIEAEI